MNLATRLLLWCALATFPLAGTHAQENVKERIVELNGYVRAETGYTSRDLPRIVYRSNEQIAAMMHTPPCRKDDPTAPCVMAAAANGTIILMDGFHFGDDDDILVHELTHFQQWASGKDMPKCRKEREAYNIQERFIKAAGVKGHMPNDMLRLLATSCDMEGW